MLGLGSSNYLILKEICKKAFDIKWCHDTASKIAVFFVFLLQNWMCLWYCWVMTKWS